MIKARPTIIASLVVIVTCLAFLGYRYATNEGTPPDYHRGATLKG